MADDGLRIAAHLASGFDPASTEAARGRAADAASRVTKAFVAKVQSRVQADRVDACVALAQWVENAFGDEAEAPVQATPYT